MATQPGLLSIAKKPRKKPIARGTHPGHRSRVRHSYPYEINTFTFGTAGSIRIDQRMNYYDLEDVLVLAMDSEANGRKQVAGWRRGLKGDELGRLLMRPAVGVVTPIDIIKIKWTTGVEPHAGRARVAATLRGCDAILHLVKDARKTSENKPISRVHHWIKTLRRTNEPPDLTNDSAVEFVKARRLPSSLAEITDTPCNSWRLSEVELASARSGI